MLSKRLLSVTNNESRSKEFLLRCAEQVREIHPSATIADFHYQMIIQLTGKIFELEDKISELSTNGY